MLPHEYEIDQERCEQQDAIAEQIFIDGFGDAMDGKPSQSEDEAYQFGYAQGKAQLHSNYQSNSVGGNYDLCHSNEWLEDNYEF